jgi:hypothetical protein
MSNMETLYGERENDLRYTLFEIAALFNKSHSERRKYHE